jgi:hypothetical protein
VTVPCATRLHNRTLAHPAEPPWPVLSNFGDPGHPCVADQLGIQGKQSLWFFGIATGGGLPLQQTTGAVQLSDGVDTGHEVIAWGTERTGRRGRGRRGNGLGELDLQVSLGLPDADAVFLCETIEQLNALLQHAVPGIPVRVFETAFAVSRPFPKQHRTRVFAAEVSAQCLLEGSPEQHGGPGVFLLPAFQVAVLVAPRTREVLADLAVAIGHAVPRE